jgi:trans-aconitate 2-methyltransferase
MNKNNIQNFYDQYVVYQQQSKVNERIYSLYRRLLNLNLNTHSRVLELGCGIGTVSYLLSKTVKKGLIESVDISPKSIDYAQKKQYESRVEFFCDDIVKYKPKHTNFDFIILFDVLEHIPIENHHKLFQNLSEISTEKTKILINIPNPDYINYDIKNNPEVLQIIDQPIPLNEIVKNTIENDLKIILFETYSIWVKNDYQFLIIEKEKEFKEIKLSDYRSLTEKIIQKIKIIYFKYFYNYH